MNLVLLTLTVLSVVGCDGVAVSPSSGPNPSLSAAPSAKPAAIPSPSLEPSASPEPSASHNPAAVVADRPYDPVIDPADFVAGIDNPFFPLTPGTTLVYRSGDERIDVTVTPYTREVMGVTTVVVHDRVLADGALKEDTFDWYAQDRWGNVWYFGEETTEYEDGKPVSTAGSWEGGVDGAQPGIVMLADPRIGDRYRQEFYAGEAEDMARVISLDGVADVTAGTYAGLVVTEDTTPLDPSLVEHKSYARGIGVVYEKDIKGGGDIVELVEVRTG